MTMDSKVLWSYLIIVFLSLGLFLWLLGISLAPPYKQGLTATALEGKKVWQQKNCVECHALLGNGGYNAVDLTDVTTRHSYEYLVNYLKDPPALPQARKQKHPSLSAGQAEAVINYLSSVKNIPTKDWPPKPIKSGLKAQGGDKK
ncbi:MAG: nitric oxide reductase subunit [Clostridia bacterium]|nr:nitric oxide reductase subunit [Clostridia bacterium]